MQKEGKNGNTRSFAIVVVFLFSALLVFSGTIVLLLYGHYSDQRDKKEEIERWH